jgi:type I restriction enzyme S subunit
MKGGWAVKSLGETCRFIDYRGRTPEKTARGLRLITAKNVKMGVLQRHPMEFVHADTYERWMTRGIPQIGDVIFTTEAPLANIAQLDTEERVVFAQRVIVLHPTEPGLDPTFLKYLLMSEPTQRRIRENGTGATVQGIKASLLKKLEISFPPLSEQTRIVGILDAAFDGIAIAKANTEKNLQNASALFDSQLDAVFVQRGDGWLEKTIGESCILRSGTTLPKIIEKAAGEIPYLKVADMNIKDNLTGVTCSSRYVAKNDVNASNLLPVGTTIFPKRGGAILTNKKRLTKRVICADLNIMGVTPKSGLLPEFLFNFFRRLDLRSINNGSSIPQINNYSVEPLLIAFPKSTAEQQTIVARLELLLEQTRRLEAIYQQKLAALEALKESLLHRAFTGGL